MNLRRILLVLALAAIGSSATPVAFAHDGDFVHHGHMTTFFGGSYVISQTQEFTVYLDAGATVSVTLEWFDELADLDILFVPPASTCNVLPDPDAGCLANSMVRRAQNAACQDTGHTGGFPLTSSPESATFTATTSGYHKIGVAAAFAEPLGTETGYGVDYVLTANVNGHHDSFSGPTSINYIRPNHCRALA